MAKDLSGLPIAITGASSGIGRATAIACARAGMPVALMARREGPLREAADAVEAEGVRASVFVGSVDVPGASEAFIKQAEADLGPLHAVFANAGYGAERETLAMTAADLRTMFEVNFWASLRLAQCVTPGMIERGRGHVLFCSSCLSKIGLPRYASYCASKACQDHFARALRHELRPAGVHVSSVHPIGTKTAFFDAAAARSGGSLRLMDRSTEAFMQPPSRVADAVVRCLRRPKGEVWTSLGMRLMLGLAVAAPGLADIALSRMVRSRMAGHI